MIQKPVFIYNNWSTYDLLSDDKPLTDELAFTQLGECIRLRRSGVRLDIYLMDAFWYAPDKGYREWHHDHWPQGCQRWLDACLEEGMTPGIWLATNNLSVPGFKHLEPIPEWESSLNAKGDAACMFEGGFLPHFMETLELLYRQGFRVFKFDFANLKAVPAHKLDEMDERTAIELNSSALREAIIEFKWRHGDAIFLAYNGFGFDAMISNTWQPFRQLVDLRWLECFDSLYAGDPRPADVPCANFWRSKDIYSDHMVFAFKENQVPLRRIDNVGFMIGKTGTCYFRGKEAWKPMLILALARGGLLTSFYGNLELLDEADVGFFAEMQQLFLPGLENSATKLVGGPPGQGVPYAFVAQGFSGTILTCINPSQEYRRLNVHGIGSSSRILYHDAGYQPELIEDCILLGPEQLALVVMDDPVGILPVCEGNADVRIPAVSEALPIEQNDAFSARAVAAEADCHRVFVKLTDSGGKPVRCTGGSPPDGTFMDKIIRISAVSDDRPLKVRCEYGKQIWSGLSWACVDIFGLAAGAPFTINVKVHDEMVQHAAISLYAVTHQATDK